MAAASHERKSYVIWNNKGGAGKTTLTFHLSGEYAWQNPNKKVVVIDMCPQGNISTALLSNVGQDGKGFSGDLILRTITRGPKINDSYEPTICGYLMSKLDRERNIAGEQFLTRPFDYNKYISKNLYLLCGDQYLEIIAKRLEEERKLTAVGANNPWTTVTLYIRAFIEDIFKGEDCTVFIDTNPSFSIYTELAISAASRLIVPFNSDDFSRSAVLSMFYLIYGIEIQPMRDERYQFMREYEYSFKAERAGIERPKIHLFINNKVTEYNLRSAKAFEAKGKEISQLLEEVYRDKKNIFVRYREEGIHLYQARMVDLHSKGVQALQLGCPLSKLPSSVTLSDAEKVKNKKTDNYLVILQNIVNKL